MKLTYVTSRHVGNNPHMTDFPTYATPQPRAELLAQLAERQANQVKRLGYFYTVYTLSKSIISVTDVDAYLDYLDGIGENHYVEPDLTMNLL